MKRLLIIDDNSTLLENLKFAFELNQYKVDTANNVALGKEMAEESPPDLILCDIELPGFDGYYLIQQLKNKHSTQDIPFVFLSVRTDSGDIKKAMKLGARAYIKKPFQTNDLIKQIHTIVGKNGTKDKSILIVSSDTLLLAELTSFLLKNNYTIYSAEKGKRGIELSQKEIFDLIICDLFLNDMKGYGLVDNLITNSETKETPIFILGSNSSRHDFRRAMDNGAANYFSKPINLASLLTSVELKISESRSTQETISQKESDNPIQIISEINQNNKKRILLIEDNYSLAEILCLQLELFGFALIYAENGQKGILMATNDKPALIICDILLPDISGYEILQMLKKKKSTSRIPFIFLTAKADFSDIRKGMDLGADDYFIKPVKISELVKSINKKLKLNIPGNSKKRVIKKNTEEKEIDEDFIPLSIESKEVSKRKVSNKINNPEENPKIEINPDNVKPIESPNRGNRSFKKSFIADSDDLRLELFMQSNNPNKDYEVFLYKGITIVKVNINRAVEKETRSFYDFLLNIISAKCKAILVDLRFVECISSSFIGVIISAKRKISFIGGDIRLLLDPQKLSYDLIFYQSISRVFKIYEDYNIVLEDMLKNSCN